MNMNNNHNDNKDTVQKQHQGTPCHTTFDTMPGIPTELLRGIYSHGFEKPSAIQQQAIVPFVKGDDMLGQAPSGTGKTGAFSIGLLGRLLQQQQQQRPRFSSSSKMKTGAIVLSPTRELAQQTFDVLSALGRFTGIDDEAKHSQLCELFVGGNRVGRDAAILRANAVLIAVGTPGRLIDLVKRGLLRVDGLQTIVLDEADEMLSQGFAEQIQEIFRFVPRDVQVALFSATMPPEVVELTKRLLRPEQTTRILVEPKELSLAGITQYHVKLEEDDKFLVLTDLYEQISVSQSVIFANSRRKVMWLAEQLAKQSFACSVLHAEMPSAERNKVMDDFRRGSTRVLLATDLVSRGIDVQRVSVVVNYDVPFDLETYLHRIGRSGRYGRHGLAITLVTAMDAANLATIERHYGRCIEELPMDFAEKMAAEADETP